MAHASLSNVQEVILSDRPDRIIMVLPGITARMARSMAGYAITQARAVMPKLTGDSAKRLTPTYGIGFFGIRFQDSYVWFQENGIKAFTMNSLQGKTIPMWINDPNGAMQVKNPKAKVRITESGKIQILIFRKATKPGAPGRIGVREAGKPWTTQGRVGGRIARGNVGVQWRHPGMQPRYFLNNAMGLTSLRYGFHPERMFVTDKSWRNTVPQNAH